MNDESISTFAFKVGKEIEKLAEERNGNLQKQLEDLQSKVFKFRSDLKNSNNSNLLKYFDIIFEINEK
jgi:Skp family chaperone for outer membrane proteins